MKTEFVIEYTALGHFYITEQRVKRFSPLFGILLHICFKMVYRVSDFIDFKQKDIEFTTPKNRKSKQCSTRQQLGHVKFNLLRGNTADSQ